MKIDQLLTEHKKGVKAVKYAKKSVPLVGPEALKKKEQQKKAAPKTEIQRHKTLTAQKTAVKAAPMGEAKRPDRPPPKTDLKVGDDVVADTSKEDYPGGHKERRGKVTRVGEKGVHIKTDDSDEHEWHPYKIVKKQGLSEDDSSENIEIRLDGEVVPGRINDIDHARNKASKLISYQKGKVAEVYVDGKLKMRMKLNTPREYFDEQSVAEGKIKIKIKHPPETAQEKLYKKHQELRKKSGLPDPEEYKKNIEKKQKEIDDMKEAKQPEAPKPRNFVAKNAKTAGAGKHKDAKKAANTVRGQKHKNKEIAEADMAKIIDYKPGQTATLNTGPGMTTIVDLKKNPTSLTKDPATGKLKLVGPQAQGTPAQQSTQQSTIKAGDQVEIGKTTEDLLRLAGLR